MALGALELRGHGHFFLFCSCCFIRVLVQVKIPFDGSALSEKNQEKEQNRIAVDTGVCMLGVIEIGPDSLWWL